jgi:hypothetical protein
VRSCLPLARGYQSLQLLGPVLHEDDVRHRRL